MHLLTILLSSSPAYLKHNICCRRRRRQQCRNSRESWLCWFSLGNGQFKRMFIGFYDRDYKNSILLWIIVNLVYALEWRCQKHARCETKNHWRTERQIKDLETHWNKRTFPVSIDETPRKHESNKGKLLHTVWSFFSCLESRFHDCLLIIIQISRLIYTNSGNAILALASNAIHLLWKWQRSERNSSGKVSNLVDISKIEIKSKFCC